MPQEKPVDRFVDRFVDRSVPDWPEIRESITPAGFGHKEGNQACFCTKINKCSLYIPHSFIEDMDSAKSIWEQIKPIVDKFWKESGTGNRIATVSLKGKKRKIRLKHGFSHILIKKRLI